LHFGTIRGRLIVMGNLFGADEKIEEQPTKLCPYIGNMGVPVMREPTIKLGGPPQIQIEPKLFPCQGSLCTFWSQAESKCVKLIEAEANIQMLGVMQGVAKALAPLAKFMG
jgi:hypothetical protein